MADWVRIRGSSVSNWRRPVRTPAPRGPRSLVSGHMAAGLGGRLAGDRLPRLMAVLGLLATATWVVPVVLSRGHGFDVSDEGSYVLAYRWWDSEPRNFTGAQYIYGPVFEALGHSVAWLRVVRVASVLVVHAVFGWAFMSWLRARFPVAVPSGTWVVAGTTALVAAGGVDLRVAAAQPRLQRRRRARMPGRHGCLPPVVACRAARRTAAGGTGTGAPASRPRDGAGQVVLGRRRALLPRRRVRGRGAGAPLGGLEALRRRGAGQRCCDGCPLRSARCVARRRRPTAGGGEPARRRLVAHRWRPAGPLRQQHPRDPRPDDRPACVGGRSGSGRRGPGTNQDAPGCSVGGGLRPHRGPRGGRRCRSVSVARGRWRRSG